MKMENSSEFGYQISGNSRGLNSSEASNRNPRSDHDSGIIADRAGQEKTVLTRLNRVRTQFGYFREDAGAVIRPVEQKDISLRQWADDRKRVVNSLECLHIYMQIVEIVKVAHSQGIVIHNIRPSCFVMSSLNRVSFIESASCSDSDSDSEPNENTGFKGQNLDHAVSENTWMQSTLENLEASCSEHTEKEQRFPMKHILEMETEWYTSPEEAAGLQGSFASDVYRLGVLLFELYCMCNTAEEKNATMSSLRHRVFPPPLLLKWPKVALFCLWLLHPEPASRPKIDEVLQSEFLTEPKDKLDERVAAIDLKEKSDNQDLLLEFLLIMQQRKQEAADNLRSIVSAVNSDLEEVMKLQSLNDRKQESNTNLGDQDSPDDSSTPSLRKRIKLITNVNQNEGNSSSKSSRLMRNFGKLESAYLLNRQRAFRPINSKESVNDISSKDRFASRQSRWINSFLDGLSKYLSFSHLKVKADLKQADLLSSSNLVCSLSFDRDGEFFATAGVNKKIKVFEFDSILNGNRDIHYPVVEMSSGSKLSSICWNSYIKGQIASSNFDGVVQVWDVTRNEVYMEMREHERRAWSVDFSSADPTLLASGSDDGSVKLWNINQGVSVGTIRTKANVCSVQFPVDSGNSLAFGSADHRIYYYDLRNPSRPVCVFVGHEKTVSYVKFVDSTTLVSSSTDNTLKLWDLSECSSHVVDCPVQSFTGHTNVKNFVGLSVSNGYIATGSETNEVFIYHKAFPMPTLSYKFNTVDPISGYEMDDTEQFVSSVCWRNQSSTLVAANSMGDIKLLEMV
ncbi:protein SPA1-RELATED 3-like [Bidens hawaiensis]|uniref:protein SPA1-RELATED 3-like n=1 Tax=Bidens hawaiensis TaxID=980011 RepID=UPI00404AFA71